MIELQRLYLALNPFHGPDAWATPTTSWCLSLLFRFNQGAVPYATADAARRAAGPLSTDISQAPVGAFVYLSNSHVAQIAIAGPNPLLFMASHYLSDSNGHGAGFNTLAGYIAATKARLLGWSLRYGVNPPRAASDLGAVHVPAPVVESRESRVRRVARYLNSRRLGADTRAAATGRPGPVYWRIMQRAGKQDGLYGRGYLVTGIPGPRTRWLEKHYATIA